MAASRKRSAEDPGSCLNLGILQGGSKSNVIAGDAFIHWSARLRPGESNDAFLDEIRGCVAPGSRVRWEVPFKGEPLPAGGRDDHEATVFCRRHGLPAAEPVDFWTEASLFSAAGLPAVVLGPGDIAQAHALDEWVALEQLDAARTLYEKVIRNDG